MTNAEKYLKDGVNLEEVRKGFFDYLISDGVYGCNSKNIVEKWEDFLNKKIQPTLTEDERVILRNINKEYITVGRDKLGDLFIAMERDENGVRGHNELSFNRCLFHFIKERRRI